MDQSLPAPYHIPNTRRCKGLLLLKNDQHFQGTPHTENRMTVHVTVETMNPRLRVTEEC
jgi:hypothetical protein